VGEINRLEDSMGFVTTTLGKLITGTVEVMKCNHAEYLSIVGLVAKANPREFRWAVWMLSGITVTSLLVFVYWLLPDHLRAKDATGVRNYALIVAGLVGLPLAFWRSSIASTQARTAIEQAETANRQALIAERGQLTDRFSKAIEQLGQDGTDGKPNLPVRLGAIYALERIARDSKDDAQTVFKVLAAYVCMNAGDGQPRGYGAKTTMTVDDEASPKSTNTYDMVASSTSYVGLRRDVLAAIGVWERWREKATTTFDLSKAVFAYAILDGLDLDGATLDSASFHHSLIASTSFRGANLSGANFAAADLQLVHFENSDLRLAQFTQTTFLTPMFEGACLEGTVFRDVDGWDSFVAEERAWIESSSSGANVYWSDDG